MVNSLIVNLQLFIFPLPYLQFVTPGVGSEGKMEDKRNYRNVLLKNGKKKERPMKGKTEGRTEGRK